MPTAIVAGASSGIGRSIAAHLVAAGWSVTGTVRAPASDVPPGVTRIDDCDFQDAASLEQAITRIIQGCTSWDALVVTPGTMLPIGTFGDVDFTEWAASIEVNLLSPARVVHGLLPIANVGGSRAPVVVFFAGGGTNSAPVGYSAYTVSKIALIKLCELLDSEYPQIRFAIIGPGWVRTKIHAETLGAASAPAPVRNETQRRLAENDFVSMDAVVDHVMWVLDATKEVLAGRNFSTSHDPYLNRGFAHGLSGDADLLKLRRHGNDYRWMEPDGF